MTLRSLAITPTAEAEPGAPLWPHLAQPIQALSECEVPPALLVRPGTALGNAQVTDRALVRFTRRLVASYPGPVLVSRRPDVALAASAAGAHLPAHGVPVHVARAALGESALIGRSCHTLAEVEQAAEHEASYVTFGPVWPTPSKPGLAGAIPGLEGLRRAASVGLPVLALGGVDTAERARQCLRAGASGVAGIRLFFDPDHAPECRAWLL